MSELLSKEQLESYAELFKVNTGPPFGYVDKAVKAGNALLAHCRALEAQRDRLRLPIRAQAATETLMKQTVEAFRQRAIEVVRAKRDVWRAEFDDISRRGDNREASRISAWAANNVIELLQSLPAISEQEENSEG